jgi:hypothetical protein
MTSSTRQEFIALGVMLAIETLLYFVMRTQRVAVAAA